MTYKHPHLPAAIIAALKEPRDIDGLANKLRQYPRSTVWDYLKREVQKGTVERLPGYLYKAYPLCPKCKKPLTFYNLHWRRYVCGCGKTFAKTFVEGRV